MKVEGPRANETAAIRRGASGPRAGQPAFTLDSGAPASAPTHVRPAAALGSIDTILALQGVPDAMTGRAKAVKRGQSILDMMDEVRDGLLAGQVSEGLLRRLSASLQAKADGFLEPGLQSVMNDIELRAQVELAKLQVARAASDSGLRA
jgi:hypothetical protein